MVKEQEVKKKAGNAYVTSEFRDKHDFEKVYAVNQDVTGHERLDELVAAGVVEVYAEPQKPQDPPK